MDEETELPPPRQWPLLLALLLSLLWLLAAIALAAAPWLPLPQPLAAGLPILGAVISLAAPVALVWVLVGQMRDRSEARALRAQLMADHARFTDQKIDRGAAVLLDLERRLDTLVMRLDAVADPVRGKHEQIAGTLAGLEQASVRLGAVAGDTHAAADVLAGALPAAADQADRLTQLLTAAETRLTSHLQASAQLMTDLEARAAAAEAQSRASAEAAQAGLAAITEALGAAEERLAHPLADLNARVDTAFARTASAVDTTRDAVHAQTNAMLASVEQARVTLDHIGGEAARQIEARLEAMLAIAATLAPAVNAQADEAQHRLDELARGFALIDNRLTNSANHGRATLEGVTNALAEAREAIAGLGEPITLAAGALEGVEQRLGRVGDRTAEALTALGTVADRAPLLDDMAIRLSDLSDRAEALQAPLSAGGNSLVSARGLLDDARASLDEAAEQLVGHLASARATLADIEQSTGSASLAASTQLIEVFGRVRDIANQTAGTMRETLARVVEEAEQALGAAGEARAASAFGTPIKAQLAEVEATHDRVVAAAQAAAERVTQRLVTLVGTVNDVEARIDQIETGFTVRARSSLARTSRTLLDSLQRAAVEMTGLLSLDIADGDWDAYLKGDRSLFTRRVLDRLDGETSRAIGRHFQHDAEFRSLATQYIDEFETLIAQVSNDRDGQSLATALLGSHVGRLYLAIANGAGRFAGN